MGVPLEFWKVAAAWGLWIGFGLTILGAAAGALGGYAGLRLGAEADKAIEGAKAAAAESQVTAQLAKKDAADARLAASQADERAAEARKAAAELELQAAELQTRLQNVQHAFAAREISAKQAATLVKRLKGEYRVIGLMYQDGDKDAEFYAHDWARVLAQAEIEAPLLPSNGGATIQGTPLGVLVTFPQGDMKAAAKEPLWQALETAGLWGGGAAAEHGPARHYGFPILEIPSRVAPRQRAIDAGPPRPMMGSK